MAVDSAPSLRPYPKSAGDILRRLAALAVGLVAALAFASPALAHAELVETEPNDGAHLVESPSLVSLAFNEPIGVALGAVRVFDSSGARVDRGDAGHGDGADSLVVTVPELSEGTYVVTWRVVSDDGHPVKGAFIFNVGHGGTVDQGLVASLLGEGGDVAFGITSWLLRTITYAAGLLAAGGAAFILLVDRSAGNRVGRLITLAAGAGVGASLLQIPVFAAEATGLGAQVLTAPAALSDALSSSVGWAAVTRVAAFVLLWLLAGRGVRGAGVVGMLGIVAAELLTGHTRTSEPAWLVMGAAAIHLAAATLWMGGLAALALSLTAAKAEDDLDKSARMVGRFSNLAVGSVIGLALAGLALAWVEVRAPRALVTTPYGWTLVAKTVAAVAVLSFGAYNNRVLVPALLRRRSDTLVAVGARGNGPVASRDTISGWDRFGKTVRFELVGLVLVVAATALLVNLQPAVEAAGVSGPFSTVVSFGEGQLNLVVDPNRVGVNEVHLYLLTAGGLPGAIEGEAEIELRLPAEDLGPIVRTLQVAGAGHYTHVGNELALPGEWEITVRQRVSEFEEVTVTIPVIVNP